MKITAIRNYEPSRTVSKINRSRNARVSGMLGKAVEDTNKKDNNDDENEPKEQYQALTNIKRKN